MTRVVIHNHGPRSLLPKRTVDGASISKSFRFVTSTELDLGKAGWGEVEFSVQVKVAIDASVGGLVGRNEWWVAGKDPEWDDGVKVPLPAAVVKEALERYLATPNGRNSILEAIGEHM
jgi:hypothetical protein